MMSTNRFKINQYNWLGQKLIAQHRYVEFLEVRRYLSCASSPAEAPLNQLECPLYDNGTSTSDHMNYLTGLALMKTRGIPFDGLINTLQRLDYQKNGQYFLLLCQCLLYFGSHDSVVAICKQVLNKQIDSTCVTLKSSAGSHDDEAKDLITIDDNGQTEDSEGTSTIGGQTRRQQEWCLKSACEESLEFKSIFESVYRNRLIDDPRLWFTFAMSLELQSQFKDADLAYRIASKLASGQAKQLIPADKLASEIEQESLNKDCQSASSIGVSNYNAPHIRYAEFCIRYRDDYKTATQVLSQASSIHSSPIDYNLNPKLALTLCSQPNANATLMKRASEIIQVIDNHSASTRNPSYVYNQIALRCKQKLYGIDPNLIGMEQDNYTLGTSTGDGKRLNLSYSLISSFVSINAIVQNCSYEPMLFKSPLEAPSAYAQGNKSNDSVNRIHAQIDKAIDTLRGCDSSCWLSHSLWNNLGTCYLMKRRYVASLSCFSKALQLNPLDWRINYNIALAYQHVNVTIRALTCSLAAKSFLQDVAALSHCLPGVSLAAPNSALINIMLASCYFGLGSNDEARRYYAEMVALGRKGGADRAPVLALVNYLLLLHRVDEAGTIASSTNAPADDQDSKLINRLLDQLEQDWLQRNPNDTQFIATHLEVARLVGASLHESRPQMRKSYAWTKHQW